MSKDKRFYEKTEKVIGNNKFKSVVYVARNICERCGTVYSDGNPASSKYCDDCKKTVQAEQNRERVRRYREKRKKQK